MHAEDCLTGIEGFTRFDHQALMKGVTIGLRSTDAYGGGMKNDGIKDMVISFMFMYGDTAMLLAGFTF